MRRIPIFNFGNLLTVVAQRSPKKEALVCGTERLDFATLEAFANKMANALLSLGLIPGDRIVLHMPNCVTAALAMAAIAKAGGIIVPVSTRLVGAEIRHIINDADPFAVLYSPSCRDTIANICKNSSTIKLISNNAAEGESDINELMSEAVDEPPSPLQIKSDDALLCYTSGTTGRPKGVISTHRNVVIGQCSLGALEWELSSNDRMLCATPMAHRIGIARLAGSFSTGSTLVLQERFDPAETIKLIEAEGITHIGVVPTIARMLLPHIEKNPKACATLIGMLATGEAFPVPLKEQLFAALPHLRLFSFYSQTEAGLVSCLSPDEQLTRPYSVGQPASGVEVRLVDQNLDEVPSGEPGEVLVRSGAPGDITVMREYFKRPDDNAEVFVDGWLRTGDLGKRDSDGYLDFVDRLKDMIISGGLNIYSREVEDALESHSAISEAAVVGVPDTEFGEAVLAFVVCKPTDDRPSAEDLTAHCLSRIASYKKPKEIRFVDQLPRNSTGKVAKAELRELAASYCSVEP